LSDLAVIGAFVVGAELGGVMGALASSGDLPFRQKIWLRKYPGEDVVEEHRHIEQTEEA